MSSTRAHLQRLASQTAIYGVSAIVSKFLNYLLTPYLTRILSEGVYGEMSLLYAIIPFANVLLTMGLATGFFRYARNEEGPEAFKRLFTTAWGAILGVALLFTTVVLLFQQPIAGFFRLDTSCIVATALLILVDNAMAMPLAALRQQGKAIYYTIVNITGVVVNIAACILFYSLLPGWVEGWDTATPLWVIVANLIASGVSLLMVFPYALKWVGRLFSVRLLRSIFTYSIPLVMAGFMGVAGDFIDRQLLYFMLPEDTADVQVGIYGAVGKIAALLMIFRQMYTLGAEPFFLQKFEREGDFQRLNAEATKLFTIAGIFIFLMLALFRDQFALIIGEKYRIGMGLLPLLLLANLFAGILVNLSFWYKAADRTRAAILITGIGVVATLALNLAMIPSMGYWGSAIARVLATGLMVGISYALCQKYFPVPFDLRRIGLYFLLGGAIYGISCFTELLPPGAQIPLNFLLLLGFGLAALRKEMGPSTLSKLWKR